MAFHGPVPNRKNYVLSRGVFVTEPGMLSAAGLFSLYNVYMKELLEQRIAALAQEIQQLDAERGALSKRDQEIQVRLHQVVGAIHELQQVMVDLDRLPSEQLPSSQPEKPVPQEQ